MQIGFTKSYRSKWENPIFRNLLEVGVWSWLCDTAVWQETRIRFNGELITLQRGQLITSIRFIAKGFYMSEQAVRTFLDHINTDGMINTQATHRGTLITICNYDKYQLNENTTHTLGNTPLTQHQHTANTNKKEVKKERSKESNILINMPFETLPLEWAEWAKQEKGFDDLALQDIFSLFREYWVFGKGKRTKRENWLATWRNWIRNQKSTGGNYNVQTNINQSTGFNKPSYATPKSKFQQGLDGIAAARAKRLARESEQAG